MTATRDVRELPLVRLPGERAPEVVAAFCDAFHDYPVMRYVVGDAGAEYDARLNELIGLFVAARVILQHPMLGIEDAGRIVAVATLTPPGELRANPEVMARREAMWKILGDAAKARYESLVAVWETFSVPGVQWHLNMLGTRRSHAGRGLGRRLLDEVHAISRAHPESTGVTLSTEDLKNVALYQHVGYDVVGHARVTEDLETWFFHRPNASTA